MSNECKWGTFTALVTLSTPQGKRWCPFSFKLLFSKLAGGNCTQHSVLQWLWANILTAQEVFLYFCFILNGMAWPWMQCVLANGGMLDGEIEEMHHHGSFFTNGYLSSLDLIKTLDPLFSHGAYYLECYPSRWVKATLEPSEAEQKWIQSCCEVWCKTLLLLIPCWFYLHYLFALFSYFHMVCFTKTLDNIS